MSRNLLILFFCIVTCVSALEHETILHQISSGKSYCNDKNLFGNFDLTDVQEFGAMCDISNPNKKQAQFLLENNVVPILCMGLYDVSQRICKLASNDISQIMDIFPPNVAKFTTIFNKLESSNEYSSLERFCSNTVKNYTITESANKVTEFWWNLINENLKNEDSCMSICHTNDKNKVQPLCSYIIWTNGIYLNSQKNQVESQASVFGGDQTILGDEKNLGLVAKPVDESNQPAPSDVKNYSSVIQNTDLATSLAGRLPVLSQVDTVNTESNTTAGIIPLLSSNGVASILAQGTIDESAVVDEIVKPTLDKSSDVIANKDESNSSLNLDVKHNNRPALVINADKPKSIQQDKKSDNVEVKPNPPPVSVDDSFKTVVQGSDQPVPGSQGVEQVKPKTDKTSSALVEDDFSLELTPEGVGLDQPIVADKDLQPPYSDEEMEDGDGDDVDIEPETPAKTASNKPSASKASPSKPGLVSIDPGVSEPDKAYSEVEHEILIEDHFIEAEDSHFFTYFLCMAVLTIMAYLAFHNKKKLVALAVEGRRTRGTRRRPNCSNYSKLDCSLEEAMVSNTTASVTHVLY